jgi:predicted kinase
MERENIKNMNKKLIIISGYPAAGKTTFSFELSKKLNIPFFNLDFIKSEIGKIIKIKSWEDSVRVGKSAFLVLMYILENLMKTNNPVIIENSFIKDHEEVLKYLLEKYEYKLLTYKFICNLKVLHKRFIEREYSSERDIGNKIFGFWDHYQKFECEIKAFIDFNVGDNIIEIDTSDFKKINFDNYIEIAKNFMINKNGPNVT